MPKAVQGRKTLSVLLSEEEYGQLQTLAARSRKSMSEIGRNYIKKGMDGDVSENNIEFLAPIIREQVRNVLEPMMERMIALTAKSCVQSGTAAYLAADAILKFVPPAQRREVKESYEAARKKAVAYMKTRADVNE